MTEPSSQSKKVPIILRFVGASALLVLVFRVLADFGGTVQILRSASPNWLLLGLVLALTGEFITAYKWTLLARHTGSHLPLLPAVRISFVGMFYNNLLPGSVGGDVARLLLATRYLGGRARAAASVFMQRNTGLGGLLIVGNLASWAWHAAHGAPSSHPLTWPWVWFAIVTSGYLATNLLLLSNVAHLALWRSEYDLGKSRNSVSSFAAKLKRLHQELLPYRTYWGAPLVVSVLTQLIDCTLVYVAARAIGLTPAYHLFLVTVPLVTVAALLPVTFNGIGLREIGYILLLSVAGISREAAAGIALLQFGYIALLSGLGGFLTLVRADPAGQGGSAVPVR